jgi:hypothetical protein
LKFRKSQIALAALAACGAFPLAAQAAPSISWAAPANGADAACAVNASADPTHTLRAVAYDASGASTESAINTTNAGRNADGANQ